MPFALQKDFTRQDFVPSIQHNMNCTRKQTNLQVTSLEVQRVLYENLFLRAYFQLKLWIQVCVRNMHTELQ